MTKILLRDISEILLPIFSSRIFMALSLPFKAFIHFELIRLCSVSCSFSFSYLDISVQFSQHHLPHYMFLPSLSNIN